MAWAEEAARRGAGEILLTSMDRDGTKAGFDLSLTRTVARAVSIPVIASGGVGTLEHFAEGVLEGEADAVLAASVFHFGTYSIRQVKEYMAAQGIPVRLDFMMNIDDLRFDDRGSSPAWCSSTIRARCSWSPG